MKDLERASTSSSTGIFVLRKEAMEELREAVVNKIAQILELEKSIMQFVT